MKADSALRLEKGEGREGITRGIALHFFGLAAGARAHPIPLRLNPAAQTTKYTVGSSRSLSPDQIGIHRRDAKGRRDHRPGTSAKLRVAAVDECATEFPRPEKTRRDSSANPTKAGTNRPTALVSRSRRSSGRSWSAPVLWRFDHRRAQIDGRNLAPGVINFGSQSAPDWSGAHSKTLPRTFGFKVPNRGGKKSSDFVKERSGSAVCKNRHESELAPNGLRKASVVASNRRPTRSADWS